MKNYLWLVALLPLLSGCESQAILVKKDDAYKGISDHDRLPQGIDILSITQDRYMEKVFFEDQNLNTAPYAMVVNLDDVRREIESIGYPAVLKPTQKGLGPKSNCVAVLMKSRVSACWRPAGALRCAQATLRN